MTHTPDTSPRIATTSLHFQLHALTAVLSLQACLSIISTTTASLALHSESTEEDSTSATTEGRSNYFLGADCCSSRPATGAVGVVVGLGVSGKEWLSLA